MLRATCCPALTGQLCRFPRGRPVRNAYVMRKHTKQCCLGRFGRELEKHVTVKPRANRRTCQLNEDTMRLLKRSRRHMLQVVNS